MATFLKYLGMFCLVIIATSFAFCSFGVYQGFQTANRLFAGADNYTCRQFVYELEHPETDKFAPLIIATVAYGSNPDETSATSLQKNVLENGMEPAVRKVYAICKDKPAERVLNVFTASIVSNSLLISATAPVSTTTVSATTVSPTLNSAR